MGFSCEAGPFPSFSRRGMSSLQQLSSMANLKLSNFHFSRADNPYVRQIPVPLAIIEPVADHEFIRNLKTNILEFHFDYPAGPAIEQRADLQRLRITSSQGSDQILQRKAGIDDIFDQEYILTSNVLFQVLGDPDHSFAVFAVTRNRQ